MKKLNSYIYTPLPPVQGCTNTLANNYDENAVVDDGSCTFDAASISAIISDAIPTHGAIVKQAFDDNYEPDNAVVFNNKDEDLFEYAEAIGVKAIIKSYTGMFSHIPLAQQYYPDVPFFMPLGSNQSIEFINPTTIPVIVVCGGGANNDVQNMTAYGNGLEFWDNEIYNLPVDESSFSTPVIAAKILTIMDARDCTFWEARYVARVTATRTEPNRPANTIWHKENGFGKINVENAIAFEGEIPPDPFINNTNVYTPFND